MGELRSNVHDYVDQREALQAPAPNSKAELQALGLKAAADAEARGSEAPDGHRPQTNGRAYSQLSQLQIWKRDATPLFVVISGKILVEGKARPVDIAVFATICSYGGSAEPSGLRWAWPATTSILKRSGWLKRRAVISSINRLQSWGYIVDRTAAVPRCTASLDAIMAKH